MKALDLNFPVHLKRSARAKRTRIVVTAERIEVVAPQQVAEADIYQFVHAKRAWVSKTKSKLLQQQAELVSLAPPSYHHGAEVPLQGKAYPLIVKSTKLKRIKIRFEHQFIAHLPQHFKEEERSEHIRAALIRWMKNHAKLIAEDLVANYAAVYQLKPRSIRIKAQKSRWGSCGGQNDINLNWVLVLAPVQVFEYVVVHELCHIRHKHHGPEFWNLVAQLMPQYQQHRAWLKQHGSTLMMGL